MKNAPFFDRNVAEVFFLCYFHSSGVFLWKMSSKELCLVPKNIMQEYIRKFDMENKPLATHHKPIPLRNSKSDSNLENLIELFIEGKYRKYGLNLLKYYESKPNVNIDSEGNLLRPVSGLNIMDIINFYTLNKASSDVKEKIKVLNLLIPLPEFYIRNKKSRKFIYDKDLSPNFPSVSAPRSPTPSPPVSPPPTPPSPLGDRAPLIQKVTPSKPARVTSHSLRRKRGDLRWEPY